MWLRHTTLMILFAVLLLAAPPALAQGTAPCQFILGFAQLDAMLPVAAGNCIDNQTFAANGDAVQHTTVGEFVWRKADNWTAFTDGYHTWINGPDGLQERLNSQRFNWEPNPDGLPVVQSSAAPQQITGVWTAHGIALDVSQTGAATLDWRIYTWCGPGVAPPCDQMNGNAIVDGGHAVAQFEAMTGSTAAGAVQSTTDPTTVALGAISATALPNGTLQVTVANTSGHGPITLCNEQSSDTSACGA